MKECTSDIFIDIQGFNCSFGYIPKEMAIYDGIRLSNFLFKPPFKRSMLSAVDEKIVTWSEDYHGLEWDFGNIELGEIDKILKKVCFSFNKPNIFVKGVEKLKFLKTVFDSESIPKLSRFKKIQIVIFTHRYSQIN